MSTTYKGRSYTRPEIPLIDMELTKFNVGIIPYDDAEGPLPGIAGSGTCVTIGGRFFIATAGHVIAKHEKFFIAAKPRGDDLLVFLRGKGCRDGGPTGIDVGWLELTSAHARSLEREFLPLPRLRSHCTGSNEQMVVSGSPISFQQRPQSFEGKPQLAIGAQWFPVQAIGDRERLGESPDLRRKIYLGWPRLVQELDGSWQQHPDAPGMSGGGVWALNMCNPDWRAEHAQLVGIEYSWAHRGVPDRFLRAVQIQEWLSVVAEDIVELGNLISPYLSAGRL